MTDEIAQAFDHPAARAAATASDPLDRIMLRDHLREVEIGAFQAERGQTQRVKFNLVVEVRQAADANRDDVDRILSYDTLVEAIDTELAAERLNLLETLAARIAERVLAHPLAARCFVRIEKLDRGPFALGVEIVRSAPDRGPVRLVEEDAPHPAVVFLSNETLARDDLAALLDDLPVPAILCVGPATSSGAGGLPSLGAAPHRSSCNRTKCLGPGRARPALRGRQQPDRAGLGHETGPDQRLGTVQDGVGCGGPGFAGRSGCDRVEPVARRELSGLGTDPVRRVETRRRTDVPITRR